MRPPRPHPTSLQLPPYIVRSTQRGIRHSPYIPAWSKWSARVKNRSKAARKQGREEKKRRKAEYFSSSGTNSKRVATSPHPRPESRPDHHDPNFRACSPARVPPNVHLLWPPMK
ncbi:hypothetical protein BC826DRAFT_725983 [Russula brevipes]|nr:hypothetical protein BC826DRAFT_725983 [Russula brevipes]